MLSSLHASSFVALISCRGTWCHRRVSGVNEFLDLVRGQRCEVSCGAYPFGDPYGWPPPMTSCNYIVSYVECSVCMLRQSKASRAKIIASRAAKAKQTIAGQSGESNSPSRPFGRRYLGCKPRHCFLPPQNVFSFTSEKKRAHLIAKFEQILHSLQIRDQFRQDTRAFSKKILLLLPPCTSCPLQAS